MPGSALRLNLMAQDYGTPGRDEVKAKRFGFAPTAHLRPGQRPPARSLSYLSRRRRTTGRTVASPPSASGGLRLRRRLGHDARAEARPGRRPRSNFYGLDGTTSTTSGSHMFTVASLEQRSSPSGVTLRNTTRIGRTVAGRGGHRRQRRHRRPPPPPAGYTACSARARAATRTNEILTNQTNLSTLASRHFGLDQAFAVHRLPS